MDCLVEPTAADTPLLPLTAAAFERWQGTAAEPDRAWCAAQGFEAQEGRLLCLPDPAGGISRVLFGLGEGAGLWTWAALVDGLPAGTYALDGAEAGDAEDACLAFGLGAYRFDRYKDAPPPAAHLAWPAGVDRGRVTRLVEGQCLARTLINTPAGDLGPEELVAAARGLAEQHGG